MKELKVENRTNAQSSCLSSPSLNSLNLFYDKNIHPLVKGFDPKLLSFRVGFLGENNQRCFIESISCKKYLLFYELTLKI